MTNEQAVAVLNELYAAECGSLLGHLHHAQPFVSWTSADDQVVVGRMIAEEEEHKRWLVDLMLRLRGVPAPVPPTTEWGALAYLELQAIMPRILLEKRRLMGAYQAAAARVAPHRDASALVARILERQRTHLAALERIHNASRRPALSA